MRQHSEIDTESAEFLDDKFFIPPQYSRHVNLGERLVRPAGDAAVGDGVKQGRHGVDRVGLKAFQGVREGWFVDQLGGVVELHPIRSNEARRQLAKPNVRPLARFDRSADLSPRRWE